LTFFGGMKLPASSLLGAVAWTAITVPSLSAPGKAMFAVITYMELTRDAVEFRAAASEGAAR